MTLKIRKSSIYCFNVLFQLLKNLQIRETTFFIIILYLFYSCDSPQEISKDNNAPSVKILSHETGNKISQIAIIQIKADDDNSIKFVEFLVNNIVISEAKKNDSLYFAHWNTTSYPNDQYEVKAKAADHDLNITFSDSILLEVDNSSSYPQSQNIKSIQYDQNEMIISWNQSLATDLLSYEILISNSYNGLKTSFANIFDTTNSPHLITNDYNPAIEKFYWLKVIDSFYYFSVGNGYRVMDDYPRPSSLFPIIEEDSLVFLIWTSNADSDFVSYSLNMSYQQNMENSIILFSSSNRSDTISSFPRVTSKQYYNLKTKDYWGLETNSNIEILDLGVPPIIISISIPDTIKVLELGLNNQFNINANVTDGDGLNNISTVVFKSFVNYPDSTILDTTYYSLYDDGGLDSSFYSGDTLKGDGIYSNQISLDPNINPGVYNWIFIAKDFDDRVSESKEARVVIQ